MDRYIVLQIEGGIGKNVMATAVARAISNKHADRKLLVVTSYPEIWDCNPRVYRVFRYGNISYFYNDFVYKKDTIFFLQDPFLHSDVICRKKHVTQAWCELCGVEWDGYMPELYFTKNESDFVLSMIKKDRPIMLMQPFGGGYRKSTQYSWARDISPIVAQEIADEMSKDYRIIQIRREDQIGLENVEYMSADPRRLALSIIHSDKRLFIDSYMQHAAAALSRPSTVVWVASSPITNGYGIHKNIVCDFEPGCQKDCLYEPFDLTGNPIQLATPSDMIFDKEEIIKSIR